MASTVSEVLRRDLQAVSQAAASVAKLDAELQAILTTPNGFVSDIVLDQLEAVRRVQSNLSRAQNNLEQMMDLGASNGAGR